MHPVLLSHFMRRASGGEKHHRRHRHSTRPHHTANIDEQAGLPDGSHESVRLLAQLIESRLPSSEIGASSGRVGCGGMFFCITPKLKLDITRALRSLGGTTELVEQLNAKVGRQLRVLLR